MDIFPIAKDDRSMHTRRKLMVQWAQYTGMALAASVLDSAAPYVRLPGEHDTTRAELVRHEAEVDNLYALLEQRPPLETRTKVWALWANLTNLTQFNLPDVWDLKARTALIGGVNAVTLKDRVNGSKWFEHAQSYARRANRRDFAALVYARRALAGLYWNEPPNQIRARFSVAGLNVATNRHATGAAAMAHARTLAAMGLPDEALDAARGSIELAGPQPGYPRVDDWQVPLALLMACQALARFPAMGTPVETWAQQALTMVPLDATHYRKHIHLDLAEVRVRRDDIDGAVPHLNHAVGPTMAPVHLDRAVSVLHAVHPRYRDATDLREVREKIVHLQMQGR